MSLIQAPGGKPNPYADMHQLFHAIDAAVGEQIGTVRLRHTEHRDNSHQRGFSAARMSMVSVASHIESIGIPPSTFSEAKIIAKQKIYLDQANSAFGELHCGCKWTWVLE